MIYAAALTMLASCGPTFAWCDSVPGPPWKDYCELLTQSIQGRKHAFLAGNHTYYVGGFHAGWRVVEHETLGLTHPFHHDLRSRGVGLAASRQEGAANTGIGNDFLGWEFYKDTRVLYGTVVIGDRQYVHPVPTAMRWRPDRVECDYEIDGVVVRETKFIAENDVVCTIVTASDDVTLRMEGQSFFGRHSVRSAARSRYDPDRNLLLIAEGGTTRSRPHHDGQIVVAPIMYEGMHVAIACSADPIGGVEQTRDDRGVVNYRFDVRCGPQGVAFAWAMDDDEDSAADAAASIRDAPHRALARKTTTINTMWNQQLPRFRCSDSRIEAIHDFLWSLYLMYSIEVGRGWETSRHTQTAVNNFLGIHRYDATFQIPVGSWLADQKRFAYGNVLTWKSLVDHGHYRRDPNGAAALPDNKGVSWHSGVYGMEASEHVLGAWQIFRHTGDGKFLTAVYPDYFAKLFWDNIPPFFSNHFEVGQVLSEMARRTGHPEHVPHWDRLVSGDPGSIRQWFDQRWQSHGHAKLFAGPPSGHVTTNPFWHLRRRDFSIQYAAEMTSSWVDRFDGRIFPSTVADMTDNATDDPVASDFGYTPDTAYFMIDGLFRSEQTDVASGRAIEHIIGYHHHPEWNLPVAPEAYTRSGQLFGDQYSNFNAGKLLLLIEGIAGLRVSVPDNQLWVRDAMPKSWSWMDVWVPIAQPRTNQTEWTHLRYERRTLDDRIIKTVAVEGCPLQVRHETWCEERFVQRLVVDDYDVSMSNPTPMPRHRIRADGWRIELTLGLSP